jgi:Zn-dependent peptidase ImmA (M78 family)/DNA-binding XRE family transcriptional regulator
MLEGTGDSPQFALDHLDPERIRRARERQGLTGKALAEKVGVTPSAISQFEAGVVRPDLDTLVRLALALGVPTLYFARRERGLGRYAISFDACHFRARRSVSQRTRRASLRMGEDVLDLVDFLEGEGIAFPDERVTSFVAQRAPVREGDFAAVEEAASALRKHWGLGFGPIPDVVRLLESKGVLVVPLSSAHEDVDAYSTWATGRPCVMLALNKSASRARFDAGHELGHLVLHDDTHPPGLKATEDQANRFAGAFLAPREAFYAECPRQWSLAAFLRLKERWRMSVAALVRRAFDLGRLSQSSYRRAFQQLSAMGYRKGEPGEWEHERPQMLTQALTLLEGEVDLGTLSRALSLTPSSLKDTLRANVSPEVIERLSPDPDEARPPIQLVELRKRGRDAVQD